MRWAVPALVLPLGSLTAATLATVALDGRLLSSTPSSVTTLLPGFVYASATIMKVSLLAPVFSLVAWLLGRRPAQLSPWVLASMVMIAGAPVLGAFTALVSQMLHQELPYVAQQAACAVTAAIAAGLALALISLVRERTHRHFAGLPLLVSIVLLGLFWHFRFYAFGFHQDLWAPR